MATSTTFNCLWQNEAIRNELLSQMDTKTLCALRLVASSIREHTTQPLFLRTHLTFTPSTITRPARLESLARIGCYIKHLTFYMPHNESSFLPPLISPFTGEEVTFLYTPHTSVSSVLSRPKYGTSELGDVLTQQYPPIFHAATNVPSFIRFLRCLSKLSHLTISSPDQDPRHRYRRSSVDYALISLRIALEHVTLPHLSKLSLQTHPGALLYLRAMPSIGSSPRSPRIWSQIRKLSLTIDSWDFHGPSSGHDHLRILADYIRSFSAHLTKLSFTWNGLRGPCPLTLGTDTLLAPPRTTKKLFAEVTSPMSPLPPRPPRPPIVLPRCKYLQVCNASMAAKQVAELVEAHRQRVREFDFEDVQLNVGSWEEALKPLEHTSDTDSWRSEYFETSSCESPRGGEGTPQREHRDRKNEGADNVAELIDEVIDSFSPERPTTPTISTSRPATPTTTVSAKRKRTHRRRRHKAKDSTKSTPKSTSSTTPNSKPSSPPYRSAQPTLQSPAQVSYTLLPRTAYDPNAQPQTGPQTEAQVQGVQRNVAHDALQEVLADDVVRRTSALQKAKEAVLVKLGREFGGGCGEAGGGRGRGVFGCGKIGKGLGAGTGVGVGRSELVPILFSRY